MGPAEEPTNNNNNTAEVSGSVPTAAAAEATASSDAAAAPENSAAGGGAATTTAAPSAATAAAGPDRPLAASTLSLNRPVPLTDRTRTAAMYQSSDSNVGDEDVDDEEEEQDMSNNNMTATASGMDNTGGSSLSNPASVASNNNNNNPAASSQPPAAVTGSSASASSGPAAVTAAVAASSSSTNSNTPSRGRAPVRETSTSCGSPACQASCNSHSSQQPSAPTPSSSSAAPVEVPLPPPSRCINPASEVNSRLDTQVEVRVYPCNNSQTNSSGKKKFTTFTIKPEGVIIQGNNRNRASATIDLGAEYARNVGRKLQRYELSDTRACQLLVTTHGKSFWVVPAPEAFSRHSGTCRLLGDRKHPPAPHTLQVGDFLRVGSVGVVVIETHDGVENRVLSEEKIQKIMKDTTNSNGGFLDLAETDGENSEDSMDEEGGGGGNARASLATKRSASGANIASDKPVCYMCFDDDDTEDNPLISPCKCIGDTQYVHVECLRKWHTAEADNQICFLSSVDATCSVCKSTFKSDFKLKDGRHVKLFKSSLEPPYISLLVATKHEMAQRLFNTRFQLSFSTLMKPDGRNATRPLLLGRSSGSDMVLDYRTVSARHAAIRFKNGEFIFTDAGSSNGSYLYLRRPLELSPSQSVQFRLGRSMISMKVVNKWNRRLLRAVRRTGNSSSSNQEEEDVDPDDRSIGSTEDDVRITDGATGLVTRTLKRRTRESVMRSLPPPGQLSQQSAKHLDLLYALAYPKRGDGKDISRSGHSTRPGKVLETTNEAKEEEDVGVVPAAPEVGVASQAAEAN